MEAKFTPGPWKASENNAFWDVHPDTHKYRGGICNVHDAEHIDGITKDEQKANAHLIAAAPDLYAAVESLLKLIDDSSWRLRLKTERAALAKARGENPEP